MLQESFRYLAQCSYFTDEAPKAQRDALLIPGYMELVGDRLRTRIWGCKL